MPGVSSSMGRQRCRSSRERCWPGKADGRRFCSCCGIAPNQTWCCWGQRSARLTDGRPPFISCSICRFSGSVGRGGPTAPSCAPASERRSGAGHNSVYQRHPHQKASFCTTPTSALAEKATFGRRRWHSAKNQKIWVSGILSHPPVLAKRVRGAPIGRWPLDYWPRCEGKEFKRISLLSTLPLARKVGEELCFSSLRSNSQELGALLIWTHRSTSPAVLTSY